MKKIFFAALSLAFIPGIVSAQRSFSYDSTGQVSRQNVMYMSNGRVLPLSKLDQRKIYRWANGEKSTVTGREAGERLSGYAKVFGDSAVVVPSPYTDKKK